VTRGAIHRFHVIVLFVGLRVGSDISTALLRVVGTLLLRERASGSGESSQGDGDEDGELGEHHFGGIEVFLALFRVGG